jgi:hypothetical protein
MIRRVLVLTRYMAGSLLLSLAGTLFIILSLLFWAIFFPPGQGTPDFENYFLIIAALGGVVTFLSALTIASRANRAENYPLLTRLPSRVEYLTAVLGAALLFGMFMQFLVAALALISGPELLAARFLQIPPVWIAIDILAGVLALHATDLVASGWSRVIIFGSLALLLIGENIVERLNTWLLQLVSAISSAMYAQQITSVADLLGNVSAWLYSSGTNFFTDLLGIVFWPFQAISDAVIAGGFTRTQALAPAVLLLYATMLFLLAADLFATKDLEMLE